jgi:hypothetical protein
VSGDLSAALMVRIPAGSSGRAVGKVLTTALDITGALELVLTLTSFRKATGPIRSAGEAAYALDIKSGAGVTTRFYIPCWGHAAQAEILASGIASVKEFWLYVLHPDADQVVISNFLAVADELPLDILDAVKLGVEDQRDRLIGNGVKIGTASFYPGDKSVTIDTDWSWVERYAVLRFYKAGSVDETHQANNAVGNTISLTDLYDGTEMVTAGSDVDVYLTFPVEIGRMDREILLPGVCLWYSGPDPDPRTSRASLEVKSGTATELYVKRDGLMVKWRITMDNEARSPELIAIITTALRNFMARGVVWVHGKKFWFEWTEPAVPEEPVEGYDVIPKSAYSIDISVREDSWERINSPMSNAALTTVIPEL